LRRPPYGDSDHQFDHVHTPGDEGGIGDGTKYSLYPVLPYAEPLKSCQIQSDQMQVIPGEVLWRCIAMAPTRNASGVALSPS
jgi:hypothetical protein